ncbi:MAG: hypothetical protein MUP81_01925 [Dehalococcoidia bacterium]|nr:hypothetical protein [Dehalococcoidia bacterium]
MENFHADKVDPFRGIGGDFSLGFFREKVMSEFVSGLGLLNLLIIPGVIYIVKLEKRLLNIEANLKNLLAQNGIKFIKG